MKSRPFHLYMVLAACSGRMAHASEEIKDDYIVQHPASAPAAPAPASAPTLSAPSCPPDVTPSFPGLDSAPSLADGAPNANTEAPTLLANLEENGDATNNLPSPSPTLATNLQTIAPTELTVFMENHDRDDIIVHKCNGMTPGERMHMMADLFLEVSPVESIFQSTSHQFQAFTWISNVDDMIPCPQVESDDNPDNALLNRQLLQRYILALFYYSLSGDSWTLCSAIDANSDCPSSDETPWLSEMSECVWYGVQCDENGLVTNLDLPRNGLDGILPVELFSIESMKGFSVGHNEGIRGEVPAEIAQWTQLVYLDLDANSLEGPFPNVYGISTLQAIDLNNNTFSGPISSHIADLTQLVILQIEHNQFDGILPLELMGYTLGELVLFSSQGNPWDENLEWEKLCDWIPDRRAVTGPEYLQFLLADCDNENVVTTTQKPPCSCCSLCF